eukprot:5833165-Pleurochrysis_carterae.AAC.6
MRRDTCQRCSVPVCHSIHAAMMGSVYLKIRLLSDRASSKFACSKAQNSPCDACYPFCPPALKHSWQLSRSKYRFKKDGPSYEMAALAALDGRLAQGRGCGTASALSAARVRRATGRHRRRQPYLLAAGLSCQALLLLPHAVQHTPTSRPLVNRRACASSANGVSSADSVSSAEGVSSAGVRE